MKNLKRNSSKVLIVLFLILSYVNVFAQVEMLNKAIKKGDYEKVESLINASNTNINLRDKKGKTPLMYAVKKENIEIIKLLILKGASVNLEDNYGLTAMYFAHAKNNQEIVNLIADAHNYEIISKCSGMGGYEFYIKNNPNGFFIEEINELLEKKREEIQTHSLYLDTLILNRFPDIEFNGNLNDDDIFKAYAEVKLILTFLENHVTLREDQGGTFSEKTIVDTTNGDLTISGEVVSVYTHIDELKPAYNPYRGKMILKIIIKSSNDNKISILTGDSWYFNGNDIPALIYRKGNNIFFCGNMFDRLNCNCSYGSNIANANKWNRISIEK